MHVLLQNEIQPFLIAAAVVIGLLLLELLLVMLGFSTGFDSDSPDIAAAEMDADFAGMTPGDLAAELDIDPVLAQSIDTGPVAIDSGDSSGTDVSDGPTTSPTSALGTVMDLLGLKKLPLTVSLALFLTCFACLGTVPQLLIHAATGSMLPIWVAVPAAFVGGAYGTRKLSGFIVFLIPRDETTAISERSLGRRIGTITVGTASAGNPAQVRVKDGYGNAHYAMVEPLNPDEIIAEGAEVLVVRIRGGGFRLIKLE